MKLGMPRIVISLHAFMHTTNVCVPDLAIKAKLSVREESCTSVGVRAGGAVVVVAIYLSPHLGRKSPCKENSGFDLNVCLLV